MNNQEAIELLKNMIDREAIGFVCPEREGDVAIWQYHVEALQMAISALQAQEAKTQLSAEGTTSDLISRRAAIDVCSNAIDIWHGMLGEGIVIAVRKKIEELPSAQPDLEEDEDIPMEYFENGGI